MKSFFNETVNFSTQKVLGLLSFGFCPNCMNSPNVVAEIRLKLLNEASLSTEESYSLNHITLEFIQFWQNPKLRRPRTF